jgi:alpha-tubulin suppressor-like RCC1 family protein
MKRLTLINVIKPMKKYLLIISFSFTSIFSNAQCWDKVSVGYSHNLAITEDGSLYVWGYNHFGELGTGTTTIENAPVRIGTDTNWRFVSAGTGPTAFSLAIKNDGTLWSWGNNQYGQLGDSSKINKLSPVQVGTDNDWVVVSAGYSHALGIKSNGTLWSWGNSAYFALGYGANYGPTYDKTVPTQIGSLTTWRSVSAGDRFSLAVKTDGTIWGWGYNSGNPLGQNSNPTYVMTPTQRSYNASSILMTSAGSKHSFDVKTSNLLVFWGSNVYNQSGGTTCAGCPEYYVKDLDCGNNTNAIIKTDGTLWYSGVKLGYDSTIVLYTTSFAQLGNDADWKSVSVGNQSGAAIKNDGTMWTWGWNYWGQLGIGVTSQESSSLTLVPLPCPYCITATGTDSQVVCDSLNWIDGNTYYADNNSATFNIVSGSEGGCDSLVTLNLTINILDVSTTLNGNVISSNQTGATYRWLDCNNGNAPISGETNQTFTATANGNYAVEVTLNGCVDTSACESIAGVGVKEVANNTVSIYPNPNNGMVNINLGSNNTSVNYSITSIEGKVVETGRTSTNNIIVDLSKERNGVYFIRINTESTSTVYKLIKQ